MNKKFLVIDDDKYSIFQINMEYDEKSPIHASITINAITSCDTDNNPNLKESQFIASAYIKWDGCTHWYFYGEDYYESEVDSYYHLCGSFYIFNFTEIIKVATNLVIDTLNFDLDNFPKLKIDNNWRIEEC